MHTGWLEAQIGQVYFHEDGKQAFGCVQGSLQHRLSVKICHQLIAAKPFPQAGCHNHTAGFGEKLPV